LSTKRPTVMEIVRDSGAGAAELVAVIPDASKHTLQAIAGGRIPGVTQAASVAGGLRRLEKQYKTKAGKFGRAASRLEKHYPEEAVDLDLPSDVSDLDRRILTMAATGKFDFAHIGRVVERSREGVAQRVRAYEKRTGQKLPRYGKT
jgi:hypothetical protein